MKGAEEKTMFLRIQFLALSLIILQKKAKREDASRRSWQNSSSNGTASYDCFTREYLVRTNLKNWCWRWPSRKTFCYRQCRFHEIVSEGNIALMRAVDKFNVDKGFKFSTYATFTGRY